MPFSGGFSVIELIVSISILVMVLGIVVANQSSFNSAVLLRSQTYEIALAMREIQLGAVSAASDGSGNFRSVQGVHFDTAVADRYRVFRDADDDYFFDPDEEFGFPGILDPRFEIRGTSIGNVVSVVFERPNFDASFHDDNSGTPTGDSDILITVGMAGGGDGTCGSDIRQIEVTASGQIAVLECS